MLRDELMKELEDALVTFEDYHLTEEVQRDIVNDGVNFTICTDTSRKNIHFNVFEFSKLLRLCDLMDVYIDVTDLLKNSSNGKYDELVSAVDTVQKFSRKLAKNR